MGKLKKIDERVFFGITLSETFIDEGTGIKYVLTPYSKKEAEIEAQRQKDRGEDLDKDKTEAG